MRDQSASGRDRSKSRWKLDTPGTGLAALAVSASAGLAWSAAAVADPVIEWNESTVAAAAANCLAPDLNPLHESRMYAMVHIAVHDALNSIERRYRPYALWSRVDDDASPAAAVAAAARDVLVAVIGTNPELAAGCTQQGLEVVEEAYQSSLAAISDGEAKEDGIEIGRKAAKAILEVRSEDGADTLLVDDGYRQGTQPGEWQFTPGAPFAFLPGWGDVRPFALKSSAHFRPEAPYRVECSRGRGGKYDFRDHDLEWLSAVLKLGHRESRGRHGDCEAFAADYNEVKAYGGGGDGDPTPSSRNAEQTDVALFWVGSSPTQWNLIARTASADAEIDDPWENARLFALLNIAMADGYIASFATKYHYDYWRPVTAIHNADTDDNPGTEADPAWVPLVSTPPIPDYDSAHAVEGSSAATVLARFFGTDLVGFSTCTVSHPNPSNRCGGADEMSRSFISFSEAAEENGLSRILVGFHFRDAVEKGIAHGRDIGHWTVDRVLQPMK